MKRSTKGIGIASVALILILLGGWALTYPPSDPKNMRYILWKAGLCTMDLDLATGTMIGDASRNQLVIGKTEAELRGKFGYLLEPAAASPYLKMCSEPWKDRKLFFIRTSPWMVVFTGDKATDLVLIKGC